MIDSICAKVTGKEAATVLKAKDAEAPTPGEASPPENKGMNWGLTTPSPPANAKRPSGQSLGRGGAAASPRPPLLAPPRPSPPQHQAAGVLLLLLGGGAAGGHTDPAAWRCAPWPALA